MSANLNRVLLIGNLTRDPELKFTSSGMAVCKLGLAVSDRVKKGGEWTNEPVYVDVTLWDKQAEVGNKYLKKGSQILVEGRLKLDQWVDNEGNKRSKHFITCERMQMLDRKPAEEKDTSGYSESIKKENYFKPYQVPDEEIPFSFMLPLAFAATTAFSIEFVFMWC